MPVLLILFASLLLVSTGRICQEVADDKTYTPSGWEAIFLVLSSVFMCLLAVFLAVLGLCLFLSENS